MNLPKFDKDGNITSFLKRFEMSMYGAQDHEKATTLVNLLDSDSIDLIMPNLGETWSYQEAKDAIMKEFSGQEKMEVRKRLFARFAFEKGETIHKFCDRFYLEAQVLLGSKLINTLDVRMALENATGAYPELFKTMMPAFQGNKSPSDMVEYLRLSSNVFGILNKANTHLKPPHANHSAGTAKDAPKDSTKPHNDFKPNFDNRPKSSYNKEQVCTNCSRRGHLANVCRSGKKPEVHHVAAEPPKDEGKVRAD